MADWYVDGTNGSNSNNGTSVNTPKQMIAAVLALWSTGDRMFIRRGIYTETSLDATKFVDREMHGYNGENVFIDAQGLSTSNFSGTISVAGGVLNPSLLIVGINFVNYTGTCIAFTGGQPVSVTNCFFRGASLSGTIGILSDNGGDGVTARNCTFVDNMWGTARTPGGGFTIARNNLFDGNTVNFAFAQNGGEIIDFNGAPAKDYNAYPGCSVEPHGVNTNITPVNFRNRSNLDFSLASNSAMRRRGEYGVNIGASFYPRQFVDSNNPFANISGGVNDEDYYDTNLDQPGSEGPVDAAPAIYTSGVWKIDNTSVPGAKSARIKLGPYDMPAGATLSFAGWSAAENEAPSSGSKEIIGATATTRSIEISINGGSKTAYDKNDFINTSASTVAFYVTLRVDGQTEV